MKFYLVLGKGKIKHLVVFTTKDSPPTPVMVIFFFFFFSNKKNSQSLLVAGRTPVTKITKELVIRPAPPLPGLSSNY